MKIYFQIFFPLITISFLFSGCARSPDRQHAAVAPAGNGATEIVLLQNNGFQPQTLTIQKGTKVVFKNVDNKPHWPASNPHPTHDIYPEFDPQQNIEPGSEWSFVFDKVGDWRYHDHINPVVRGEIIVKN